MNFETLMEMVPLPDVMKLKTALFVGPHPDDIEIGCGGIVKKLIDSGTEVHYLIVTDGGAGSNNPEMSIEKLKSIRYQESLDAGAYLGVASVEILDFPDGGIYDFHAMTKAIATKIVAVLPDGIFTPDPLLPTETHPDHLNCAKATTAALMVAKFRFSLQRYGIEVKENQLFPSNTSLFYYYTHRPNVIVPLTENDFETKIKAITQHKSQFDESFEKLKLYLYYKANSLGQKIGRLYAEGVFALAPEHQHCFMEDITKY
ncbi:MAG: PIG-L family deacetylase [Bacilli bacterium]|nr:PIG-L family deacetylase [Bacilli bacterium]MDD4388607.1 PIG-L family deacetylase [Bacilli bacterium]